MIIIPHLETDVTTACQLSCVACNHLVPLHRQAGVRNADPAQVERDLNHLSTIVHAGAWGALGGEPLLNRALVDILRIARRSRVADKIEVWTNGILLNRMNNDFWLSFDRLVLSRYAGKLDDDYVDWIKHACDSYGVELVIKDERLYPNFRTLFEPTPTDERETRRKFAGCFFRAFSRVADDGYFFTCCCAPHMPSLVQGRPFGTDGVEIAGLTESALRAYLERTQPLGCCDICAGRDTAKSIPWSEERDPAAWSSASAGLQEKK